MTNNWDAVRVLIADDDPVFLPLLAQELESLGYNVMVAVNGTEAWELYQSFKPNIVLTDWVMPEIDGLELSRMIRAENRAEYAYIIFLTILHGRGSFLEAMRAGADDFINKPFDKDQLHARLKVAERILNLQREIKQLEVILPLCSYCKRIRDERDTWYSMEDYISMKTDTIFSHSVCPNCYERHVRPQLPTA